MKNIYLISGVILLMIFVISSSVSAQNVPSIKYVLEHIVEETYLMGPEPKKDPNYEVINTARQPNVADVLDAMRKGKKVSVVVIFRNENNTLMAHAVRVVAVNLTSYVELNAENETVIYNQAEIYDPASNITYNSTFAFINDTNKSYLFYYGWTMLREVLTITKAKVVAPRNPLNFQIKPVLFTYLSIITNDYRKNIVNIPKNYLSNL